MEENKTGRAIAELKGKGTASTAPKSTKGSGNKVDKIRAKLPCPINASARRSIVQGDL